MSWALEKRLTETVPLSTHNTCIIHHLDIVIEPNICFGRSKKSLTETVLLSTHNTCKDTLFFWRSDKKHKDLLWGRFRVPDSCFYFRETILLLTQTKPEVIKPFPRSTQPITTFIMLTNVKMPTIVGSLTLIIMINTSPGSVRARELFIFQPRLFFWAPTTRLSYTFFFSRGLVKNIMICFEDVLGCPIINFIFGRLYYCWPKQDPRW